MPEHQKASAECKLAATVCVHASEFFARGLDEVCSRIWLLQLRPHSLLLSIADKRGEISGQQKSAPREFCIQDEEGESGAQESVAGTICQSA